VDNNALEKFIASSIKYLKMVDPYVPRSSSRPHQARYSMNFESGYISTTHAIYIYAKNWQLEQLTDAIMNAPDVISGGINVAFLG
jgi:hypothetical protein